MTPKTTTKKPAAQQGKQKSKATATTPPTPKQPSKKRGATKTAAPPASTATELTDRQRILAQEKAKGATDTDACKSAGYKPKSVEAACNQVARMMRNDEFCKYLNSLRDASTSTTIKTAAEIKEGLTRLLDIAERQMDFTGYVALAARLSRMEGHDQPEKREIDLGDKTLDAVREKAASIASPLARSLE